MTNTSPRTSAGAAFAPRHIGITLEERDKMLSYLGYQTTEALLADIIPAKIKRQSPFSIGAGLSEAEILAELASLGAENEQAISLIGQGYYGCHMPPVILRNVLENPAWYTAYTPYQPEISQGRLEAILNFQTMVCELTAMELANSSLLDEATAAVEAMLMAWRLHKTNQSCFQVDADTHPQIISLLKTRAKPLGITIRLAAADTGYKADIFGALISYPASAGHVRDISSDIARIQENGAFAIVASDLLALTLLRPPGEMGADIVIGSSQRFGVPFGFGGPHAAFFATKSAYQRAIPGRLVGVSKDRQNKPAYRLALQTREQHIRRDKATSNICTAQVLLAVIAGFYGLWHGPDGLRAIANRAHHYAKTFAASMAASGRIIRHSAFFDTVAIEAGDDCDSLMKAAADAGFNLRPAEGAIIASFDETTTQALLDKLITALGGAKAPESWQSLPKEVVRTSVYMTHPVFTSYQTETEMMRYMRALADRDLALDRCMIPLGSCTMKLNAAAEMIPITWPAFANIHPYAPASQTKGYATLIERLDTLLQQCTGYAKISLQPNSGAQGEFAGLLAIMRYHEANGEGERNVCLIPQSAHGTNPASAALAGMRIVVVNCDDDGNVDITDLQEKINTHGTAVAAMMLTYPSTHGVFEEAIQEICHMVHDAGGQVYVDGANFNALVGHCAPPEFGADVSHLNLHKTFCIPHGGGGPGIGPIGVAPHLVPFLPDSPLTGSHAVSAAEFGSAGILPITYAYIRMMGETGLFDATAIAILSANYIAKRLHTYFPILYTGRNGHVAHECIIDIRPITKACEITNEDIAKRLIDYGFHAPTMSFPVAGTLMIEPTESESLSEIERFCEAMIAIADEISQVQKGHWPRDDNPLVNAPHVISDITQEAWDHPYSRQQAAALDTGRQLNKYWPPVSRVDNAYGDRHLICICPSPEEWQEAAE